MKALEYAADATADIEAIWDYTYDRWGLEKAVTYDAALEVRIRGLLTGHTASRAADDVAPGLRRAKEIRAVFKCLKTNGNRRGLHPRIPVGGLRRHHVRSPVTAAPAQALSDLRPRARRAFRILRPALVAMRERKPWRCLRT